MNIRLFDAARHECHFYGGKKPCRSQVAQNIRWQLLRGAKSRGAPSFEAVRRTGAQQEKAATASYKTKTDKGTRKEDEKQKKVRCTLDHTVA